MPDSESGADGQKRSVPPDSELGTVLNELMESEKKPNEKICRLSPLNMCKNKKEWYIHDLLNIINNHTKFQHNLIRTKKNSVKTDTAVSLKYN